jgi:aspartate carbamoyltransferase regulatory subunit
MIFGIKMPAIRIEKIKYGTVIDHITAGKGTKVIEALDLPESDRIVSMVMNIESKKLGKKDIIKIEGVHLDPKEISSKISSFAPKATVNLIENSKIMNKVELESL